MDEQPKQPKAPDADAAANNIIAAIGYFWILCFVPLFLKKDSRFAQFHGKQGFLLFALSIALWIVGWFPFLGWLVWWIGNAALTVLALLGAWKAFRGEYWELPVLGAYAKKIEL